MHGKMPPLWRGRFSRKPVCRRVGLYSQVPTLHVTMLNILNKRYLEDALERSTTQGDWVKLTNLRLVASTATAAFGWMRGHSSVRLP
jgi:hypothetical protein